MNRKLDWSCVKSWDYTIETTDGRTKKCKLDIFDKLLALNYLNLVPVEVKTFEVTPITIEE